MSEELKFLIWSRADENEAQLMQALAAFEVAHPAIKIAVNNPPPLQMWPEIVRTALYGFDIDIGEVGSTHIESLKGMDALRPFTDDEILFLGGEGAFVKAVYEAGCDHKRQLWAVPWTTDSRVIFYRRDLLAKAGINEETAFQTPAQMEQTLQRLQESGVEIPLSLGTDSSHALTAFTACWVWGAGGNYIAQNGTEVIFNSPEAQRGFCDYFNLGRYLAPTAKKLDIAQSDRLFRDGKAAVTYSGTWLPNSIDSEKFPNVDENLGVALPPGVPLVGGTHLVIWKRTLKDRHALDLIRFLTSAETLLQYPKSLNIPARLDALIHPIFSSNIMYQTFNEAIRRGRSVPALPLWGLVEDRLCKTLQHIWGQIDADPSINIENLVADSMNTLVKRLNSTLG